MREAPAGSAARHADSRRLLTLFVAFLLAPLPWAIAHFLPPHNHDAAALLQFAERWLQGERLYVDLIDVNPPLIIMLSLLPAAIGQHTPIAPLTALIACTFAFIGCCVALSFRLLVPDGRVTGSAYRLLLPPLILYLTIVLPGIEFSQRENLMVASAFPYLLLAAARIDGQPPVPRRLALAVALIAAVGFAIKPHFLIVPALVEAYVLAVRGPRPALRDPVPWTMAAFFAAYAAFVVAMLPEYLSSVVPLVRAQYLDLGVGAAGRWRVLYDSQLTPTALLFLPLLGIAAFVSRLRLSRMLALAAFGAIVFAVVQGKGWAYHVLPAECFVLALAGVLACEALERASADVTAAARRTLHAGLLVGFMLALYYLTGMARPLLPEKVSFETSQAGQLLERVAREAHGRPVLALTPGLYPHFPVLNYVGSIQAMRFMNLWVLQSVYTGCLPDGQRYREPERMPPAERLVFEAVAEDLARYEPRLVVVDKDAGILWCGREFDLIEYFTRNPAFAALWSRYEFVEEFDRYRLFVRR